MKFEEAMAFLRKGKRIYRMGHENQGSLCGDSDKVLGSFYMTIWDILAEDWIACEPDIIPEWGIEYGKPDIL